jgi:ABC-type Fe3+-siderophore transport system permease subunit
MLQPDEFSKEKGETSITAMIGEGDSATFATHRFVSVLTVVLFATLGGTSAQGYASNISVSADINTATLTWTAATSNGSAASYILALLLDGGATPVTNYTLSDVATDSYTLSNLVYSTFYTVKLYTVDSSAQIVGVSTLSFWTLYKVWNPSFIAALAVFVFIIIILVVMMALKSKYLAEKEPDMKLVFEEEQADEGVEKTKDADKSNVEVDIF